MHVELTDPDGGSFIELIPLSPIGPAMSHPRRQRLGNLLAMGLGLMLGTDGVAAGAQDIPNAPVRKQSTAELERQAKELERSIEAFCQRNQDDQALEPARRRAEALAAAFGKDHWKAADARSLVKSIERFAKLKPAERATARATRAEVDLAERLILNDKFDEAKDKLERVIELNRRLLGPDVYETLNAEWMFAHYLKIRGRHTEAKEAFERNIRASEQLYGADHPNLIQLYSSLGATLQEMKEPQAALKWQEKALAVAVKSLGPDDHITGVVHNYVGMALDELDRHSEARGHFEKALAIAGREKSASPTQLASYHMNLAANAMHRGAFAESESEFRRALALYRTTYPDGNTLTAVCLFDFAVLLDKLGRFSEGEELLREALNINQRVHPPDHPDTLNCLSILAPNLAAQGRLTEAEPLYLNVLKATFARYGWRSTSVANVLNNLANLLDDQGRDEEAERMYRDAVALWEQTAGRHRSTADALNNLGMFLARRASGSDPRFDEAERLLKRSLDIRRELLGPNHPDTIQALNNLGGLNQGRRRFDEAERFYREAYELGRKAKPEVPILADSANNLATVLARGGKLEAAERLYREALDIRERLFGRNHARTAQSYRNLASIFYDLGRFDEAERAWTTAAQVYEATRMRVSHAGAERVQYAAEASPLPQVAILLARRGKPAEAWKRLEQHLARGLLDDLEARRDRRMSPADRTGLRQRLAEIERVDNLIDQLGGGAHGLPVGMTAEELKRRLGEAQAELLRFREHLAQSYGSALGRVSDLAGVQAALPADTALISWVDYDTHRPRTAESGGEHWGVVVRSKGDPVWIRLPGSGPEQAWTVDDARLSALIRGSVRRPRGARTAATGPLLSRLGTQRLAPLSPALGAGRNGLPAVQHLIVLGSGSLAGIPVEALQKPGDTRTISYAPSASVLMYLVHQERIDPKGGLLAVGDPDFGERPAVPQRNAPLPTHGLLVTAVRPRSATERSGLKTGDVLQRYDRAELHTVEDLKKATAGAPRAVEITIWRGDNILRLPLDAGPLEIRVDRAPAAQALADRERLRSVLEATRSGEGRFQPLPGTGAEIDAMGEVFRSAGLAVRLLKGREASELGLERMAAGDELRQFAFLHFATHGVIDNVVPARSAIILSQTGLPDPLTQVLRKLPVYDGRLSAREIERSWDLSAAMVVLSACDTAVGRYAGGEGFVGFTQPLLVSGARAVCLSLWKVDDEATALLMQRFYMNLLGRTPGLRGPMSRARALAEAKSWLRDLTAPQRDRLRRRDPGRARGPVDDVPPPLEAKGAAKSAERDAAHPFAHPYYWAAFILVGDPR